MPRPTKTRARERLQRVLDAIADLKQLQRGSPEFDKWHRDTKVAIANTFEESPSKAKDFEDIRYHLSAFVVDRTPESEFQEAYVRGLNSAAAILQSMIDEIEEY